jgi:phenylacetic acid degradation operon negative regulatory protein
LRALELGDEVVIARAHDDAALGGQSLSSAVPRAWDLAGVAADYRRFLARFGGVIQRFRASEAHDPAHSFIVRTLLIHEYRRVLLRDPQLPASCCRSIGRCRSVRSAAIFIAHASRRRTASRRNAAQRARMLPPASPDFYHRFGGLES